MVRCHEIAENSGESNLMMQMYGNFWSDLPIITPGLPVIPCEDWCLDPQTRPFCKVFRGSKHRSSQGIWRILKD